VSELTTQLMNARQEVERDKAVMVLADELVTAVQAGDAEGLISCVTRAMGMPRHATVRDPQTRPKVVIYKYLCPYCDPAGPMNPGGVAGRVGDRVCVDCSGAGVLTADQVPDPSVFGPGELREIPRPPAVMRRPCTDCAYRPGSPESDTHPDMLGVPVRPDAEVPFFCHHGMVRVGENSYEASAYVGTLPLGAMVCAGWWALATGEPLPDGAYRDPGGSLRPDAAPEVPA
jgi:hypothetical protein